MTKADKTLRIKCTDLARFNLIPRYNFVGCSPTSNPPPNRYTTSEVLTSTKTSERESSIATVGSTTPQAPGSFHLASVRDRNSLLYVITCFCRLFQRALTEVKSLAWHFQQRLPGTIRRKTDREWMRRVNPVAVAFSTVLSQVQYKSGEEKDKHRTR